MSELKKQSEQFNEQQMKIGKDIICLVSKDSYQYELTRTAMLLDDRRNHFGRKGRSLYENRCANGIGLDIS